jgi:uncharacterized protein YyaL (SSP411 family)
MKTPNKLINETSPYLLQHAYNPVNWLPYGEEAFLQAKLENKPILISIGYSSCHWCHVMERESFENEDIARLMNDSLVCVKVDREERPDVDNVFMDAVQQIHGSGGWPLNCFALPDGRPFWGGTYFKPEQRKQLILNVSELYKSRLKDLENQAGEISEGVASHNYIMPKDDQKNTESVDIDFVCSLLTNAFDTEKGGMKGAPKFPMPVVLKFLLQYSLYRNQNYALRLVEITLQHMANGGIFDQAGGGFCRYSTDSDWKVPHFEKMLYDNAQLVSLYSTAFLQTGNILYKDVIAQTIGFVFRELTAPEGIFYSAIDADSEGEEGHYYTWNSSEFKEVLGHYAPIAGEYFGIDGNGAWENGSNILLRPGDEGLFAQQHFLSVDELASLTVFCCNELLKARSVRPRPEVDDKMLVAWNAMMISALADASIALDEDDYLQHAVQAGNFILQNLKRDTSGLFHTWKNGKSQIHAFLDDYAFTIDAFINLFSITTDEKWLEEAEKLVTYVIDNFSDQLSGFFWYSETGDGQVFARKIEIYDGVIPSGNSVMAHVLNTLGIFLQQQQYVDSAASMLLSMKEKITNYPAAYSNWTAISMLDSAEQHVIAVVGPAAISLVKELKTKNLPQVLIFGSTRQSNLSYFKNRYVEGKTLIYVCTETHCLTPVETVEDTLSLLADSLS